MYILLIFWLTKVYSLPMESRPAIESVEFLTMEACQEAIKAISKGNIPGERYYLCLKR